MGKLSFIIISLLSVVTSVDAARRRQSADDIYVSGYTRSNGTYVQPHYRSKANAYNWDNYNYKPSEPQNNPSFYQPTKNYGSDYYKPNPGRLNDLNPDNDSPSSEE